MHQFSSEVNRIDTKVARCEWEMNGYKSFGSDQSHPAGATLQSTAQTTVIPPCPINTTMPLAPSNAVSRRRLWLSYGNPIRRLRTETSNSPHEPTSTCCIRVEALHTDPTVTGGEVFIKSTLFGRLYEQNRFRVMEDITLQVLEKWARQPEIQHFFMLRPAMEGVVE